MHEAKQALKAYLLKLLENPPPNRSVCMAISDAVHSAELVESAAKAAWVGTKAYAAFFKVDKAYPVTDPKYPGANHAAFYKVYNNKAYNNKDVDFWEGPYGENRIKFVRNLICWCNDQPWETWP